MAPNTIANTIANNFAAIISCNLSQNTYSSDVEFSALQLDCSTTGKFSDLIDTVAARASATYSDMLKSCFSKEALLSAYQENPQHNFQNAFVKIYYGHEMNEQWVAVVSVLSKDEECGDINCTLHLRSIDIMYNECEVSFLSETSRNSGSQIIFNHDACKLALVLDMSTGRYQNLGGTFHYEESHLFGDTGNWVDLFTVLGTLMDSPSDQRFCTSPNLIDNISSMLKDYGGYHFIRCSISLNEVPTWHELAFLSLVEDSSKVLITFKDIQELLSNKLSFSSSAESNFSQHNFRSFAMNAITTAVNAVPYPYCCIDVKEPFKIIAANEAFFKLTGYNREQFSLSFSDSLILVLHPADLPYSRRHFKETLKHETATSELEYRIIRSTGSSIWIHSEISTIEVPSGHISFLNFTDITEKKKASESGISSHQIFTQTYSKSANILFSYGFASDILKDRGGFKETLGFPSIIEHFRELLLSEGFVHPEDKSEIERVLNNIRAGSDTVSGSLRIKVPNLNDDYARVSFTLSLIFGNSGMPDQIIGVIDKVTVQKEVVSTSPEDTIKMETSSNIFNIDLNSPRMADTLTYYTVNLSLNVIESSSSREISGISISDHTGERFNEVAKNLANTLIARDYSESFIKLFNTENLLAQFEQENLDLVNVFHLSHPALTNMWVKVFTHIAYDSSDNSVRALIYSCDVSEEYQKISSLVNASSKDPLTGLHNRARAKELISDYLGDMTPDEMAAFLIIDLDNFKEINDTYGHQTGDEYLKEFADALSDFLPYAYVSRLGGDEFIVFLKQCRSVSEVSDCAFSILKIIKDINNSHITPFNTTGSIGIALAPSNGHDFDTLYQNADLALYTVKNSQKDGYMFCDEENQAVHHSNSKHTLLSKNSYNKTNSSNIAIISLIVFLLVTIFISLPVTLNLYNVNPSRNAQVEENYVTHSDYVYKQTELFLTDKINNVKSLAYYAGLHFNDANFKAEMDKYIQFYTFNEVEFITPSGKQDFYRYGKRPVSKDALVMLDDTLIYTDGNLPKAIRETYIERGTLVFSHSVLSGDKIIGHLICTIDAKTAKDYLGIIASYNNETTYLAARDGIIIAGSDTTPSNLNRFNNVDYFRNKGFIFDERIFKDSYHIDNIQIPSMSKSYAKYLLYSHALKLSSDDSNQKISVISVVPVNSLSGGLTNLLILILIFVILCAFTILFISLFLMHRKRKQRSYVRDIAYKDDLTKLNNMNYLYDHSKPLIKMCGEPCAIVSINVDNFQIIKETYGAAKSNKLITCIGNGIADFISENENAARYSDDRYCVLLSFINEEDLTTRLKDLRTHIFTNCTTYMPMPISFTLSIGVYLCDTANQSIKQSYEMAELARTYFRDTPGDGIYYYDAKLQQRIHRQKTIEDSIDAALENGEFIPFYQPIVNVYNHKIVSAEALTRWQKADGTMIPPIEFIPLLEKHGTIVALDYYIFERVCAQMQVWKNTPLCDINISVNMSRQHFYHPDFVERLTRTTAKYDVPNEKICIEITENIYIEDDQLINSIMLRLKEQGFRISMDDFGTGYSSMSMLQKMPIDIIKIDKQFLDSSLSSDNGIIVLEGIVNIAKQLGLKTVCEGVDSSNQINWLKAVGCDMIQGFYYSKPVAYTAFENFYIDYTSQI